MSELKILASKIPNHLIIQKRLWAGIGEGPRNDYVDIDHIDNDLDKPLDYVSAFKKMIKKLEGTEKGGE